MSVYTDGLLKGNFMRIAFLILIAVLVLSAFIGIGVILFGSFDGTEIRILATCGVLGAYTALITPSLFHIKRSRALYLTRIAIVTTSGTLAMILWLIWGSEPIGGGTYFRVLASLGILAVATNHSLILLATQSGKLMVKICQRTTVIIIVLVTGLFLGAIWNDGLPEPVLRIFLALVILDVLGSLATPILVKSGR